MKEQPCLEVRELATADLVPYARNAKVHTSEQVEQIAKSVDEFGFNDPVAVWHNADGEMEIIEGHGRVLAAKKLGLGRIPVITLDHLSDAQRRAYTHIHNQLNMNTGWDLDTLSLELDEIEGFDWEDYGFELLQDDDGAASLDGSEDELPDESGIVCRCKPGEVWLCGDHRVMCGSSASAEDMATLMGG